MREIGGYIELETFRGRMLHEEATKLNCGRNALAYLCEAKKIEKLYLPYFLCSSVLDVCEKLGVPFEFYHVDETFMPQFPQKLGENEWLYIVNYYGQLSNETLKRWKDQYGRIIVDNAQSYFQLPVEGVDTLYTCRKFFGVADGAFLYTDVRLERELQQDESFERMHFLLGRYERSANEFYAEYAANNKLFAGEPVKMMSKLTQNLLHGVDYDFVCARRTQNFVFLHKQLGGINKLSLNVPQGSFMYPLWIENGAAVRKKLQAEKIYIPTLWPNVLQQLQETAVEYQLAADILPLPVDQRYGAEEMQYLAEQVQKMQEELK